MNRADGSSVRLRDEGLKDLASDPAKFLARNAKRKNPLVLRAADVADLFRLIHQANQSGIRNAQLNLGNTGVSKESNRLLCDWVHTNVSKKPSSGLVRATDPNRIRAGAKAVGLGGSPKLIREETYREFVQAIPGLHTPREALSILDNPAVPLQGQRVENFKRLVSENFAGTGDLELSSTVWPVAKRTRSVKAYRYFEDYAQTDYGALMIARVLADNKTSAKRFSIGLQDRDTAQGQFNGILIPTDFPKYDTFPFSGQRVHPLAIIHHEFGHTKFNPQKDKIRMVNLDHERQIVLRYENPVRMLEKNRGLYEPRYTYTSKNRTINIITGVIEEGKLTTDPKDPRIMRKPR